MTAPHRLLAASRAHLPVALAVVLACGSAVAAAPPPAGRGTAAAPALHAVANPLATPYAARLPAQPPASGELLLAAASLPPVIERAGPVAAGAEARAVTTAGPVWQAIPMAGAPQSPSSGAPMPGWGVLGAVVLALWIALRRSG